MLTQEQVDFYHRNGYISIENVLSEEEVTELCRVTDEFVEKSRQVREHTDIFDLEPGHTAQEPRLRRLKNPSQNHQVYNSTLRHSHVLTIVSQLIGPAIRYFGDKLNMKSSEFGSPVEWHQDFAFYPHTNDDLLAVGVAIDDMTKENGCLLVIPGSHKGPIYNHHQNGFFVGAVTDPDFDPDGAIPLEVRAGGISIHHVRTLHGSAPNVSNKPRRLLLLQYNAVDAWPLLGVPDWDAFNDCILQGEPTYQPRLTQIPVRIPRPYSDHTGSIYEVQSILEQTVFGKKAK